MARKLVIAGLLAATLGGGSAAWALSPFIVFFDTGGTRIAPRYDAVLDNAVRAFRQLDARQVEVMGFTDRVGTSADNLRLARRRAEAVRAALAARGYPAASIIVAAAGEDRPLVETADGVSERQNRFVTITMTQICRGEEFGIPPSPGC